MFLYGTSSRGACDRLDGIGHVETEFSHVCGVPLIARRSLLVLEGGDDRTIELPVQARSVLAARVRAGLVAAACACVALGLAVLPADALGGLSLLVAAALCLASVWGAHVLFARTTAARRAQVLADAGLVEEPLPARAPEPSWPSDAAPLSIRTQQRRAAEAQRAAWSALQSQRG